MATLSQDEHRVQWEQQLETLFASAAYDELAGKEQQAGILAGILTEEKVEAPVKRMFSTQFWWVAASVDFPAFHWRIFIV